MISTPEEIIEEARNGRMFILVDDEDRENEGDLIIPAQMTTPEAINFMAVHGRGLICLALTRQRVDELCLVPMAAANRCRNETAFTVSIEAREGVTTGISAGDRSQTIMTAISADKSRDDLVTPGHVFPLAARDGGVLVRAGHTEAAVDISRLAGLNPSGVICEIMNENGTMARLPDLVLFAEKHGLKIGTIRDLMMYRLRNDHLVEQVGSFDFLSEYGGDWRFLSYRNKVTGELNHVMQKGVISPEGPTLVRVHTASLLFDMLGQPGPRKRILQRAMDHIGERGAGVILLIPPHIDEDPRIMLEGQSEAMDDRTFGIGAQILADLNIHDMVLLTNSGARDMVGLEAFGLRITQYMEIPEVNKT
ncbi:3,4-dihydroxy-2-butanone-4-phosphate synthase [Bradyrhizobium liaoningense]|uniref:3,4-dihydroxy-2-butanone-4-phosphate synthase n=1 Tax=Bradyrhizobium liaoningense TaxID=43992 RepID=UPI001BA5C470|nr:3,4-dihydroxy-2-butanone-4-phosphate synthase [Bradyrhizobium liaoningense]MBR0840433.1 3,4-dihydroxy-2-butanone-4-phosphate synthase [Bradyrhizobium liaoningense]